MAVEVALAMLQREGRWLMQLRDEIPTIVAPGCWGLFGGHLDPGEKPEQALRRELLEEISWEPAAVECVMVHHIHRRTANVHLGVAKTCCVHGDDAEFGSSLLRNRP